ncbi:MAG: 50S ribosomal protein L10 [Candidatus Micrarchaeota archaeon]|nr:50S ribosomal protein L10 [Candidatus Micrarchaeota archaeon]
MPRKGASEKKKSSARLLKEQQVDKLAKEISKYPVVALFSLTGLPARYLQRAKSKLRGQAEFRIAKSAVLERALKKAKLDVLLESKKGPCGIILSSTDPFKLFKELKRSRGQAYAKPGQISPTDIVIPAGETQFPAGPVLSEFKQAGLDVKIVGGKIHISKDKTLVKKGEAISDGAAKILQKLDIKPFDIGVELATAYRDGTLYASDVLDVDEKAYLDRLVKAFLDARALSVEVAYPTKDNVKLLITKAHRNARALAIESGFPEKEVLDQILAKAAAHAKAIESKIGG